MQKSARMRPSTSAYVVTCHTYHHAPILAEHIDLIRKAIIPKQQSTPFKLMAWVIEPGRFQMIIDPRGREVVDIVNNLKAWFDWHFRIRTDHRGPIWEPRFTEERICDQYVLDERVSQMKNEDARVAPAYA